MGNRILVPEYVGGPSGTQASQVVWALAILLEDLSGRNYVPDLHNLTFMTHISGNITEFSGEGVTRVAVYRKKGSAQATIVVPISAYQGREKGDVAVTVGGYFREACARMAESVRKAGLPIDAASFHRDTEMAIDRMIEAGGIRQ